MTVIFCSDGEISVGGGCIFYISNCYNATLVEDLINVPDTEIVWGKLILSKMSIFIAIFCYATSATVVN